MLDTASVYSHVDTRFIQTFCRPLRCIAAPHLGPIWSQRDARRQPESKGREARHRNRAARRPFDEGRARVQQLPRAPRHGAAASAAATAGRGAERIDGQRQSAASRAPRARDERRDAARDAPASYPARAAVLSRT